ncbi:hypothetical protein CMO93_02135 [Candidatus Woesearchaeota archaeon]|nr:hypothetical protein [Candidatus Woesearchaeota archaeon]|tara:strand:- start:7556 stop:8596 length:1041 start_codon:yes stop_codon:yes gene_type:complete
MDLEAAVKSAVKSAQEGNFSDGVIQLLKDSMVDLETAGEIANMDSTIAEFFRPRKKKEIKELSYGGKPLYSGVNTFCTAIRNSDGVFTSGRDWTYNELLDYGLLSRKDRRDKIIETLKDEVGEEIVDSYISWKGYNPKDFTAPKDEGMPKQKPETNIGKSKAKLGKGFLDSDLNDSTALEGEDILEEEPEERGGWKDGTVYGEGYLPPDKLPMSIANYVARKPEVELVVTFQKHYVGTNGVHLKRYPSGGVRDGYSWRSTVCATEVSTKDGADRLAFLKESHKDGSHKDGFPKWYIRATEIMAIHELGEEGMLGTQLFAREGKFFYTGPIFRPGPKPGLKTGFGFI